MNSSFPAKVSSPVWIKYGVTVRQEQAKRQREKKLSEPERSRDIVSLPGRILKISHHKKVCSWITEHMKSGLIGVFSAIYSQTKTGVSPSSAIY